MSSTTCDQPTPPPNPQDIAAMQDYLHRLREKNERYYRGKSVRELVKEANTIRLVRSS